MVLFWYKCGMFNIGVNQSQFTLFMAKLKNLTSNQMKKNAIPNTFWRTLADELINFTWIFISIWKAKRSKNLLPTSSFAKIHNKHVQFQIFHFNSNFDYLLRRINWRASHEVIRQSFGCQMMYKIRPGQKQLTSKNKFCKAYMWRKQCRVKPPLS